MCPLGPCPSWTTAPRSTVGFGVTTRHGVETELGSVGGSLLAIVDYFLDTFRSI